jgi:hypothetical protein
MSENNKIDGLSLVLKKLRHNASETNKDLEYFLNAVDLSVMKDVPSLNTFLGKNISLDFSGKIFCLECQKKTTKSFNQGYCFNLYFKTKYLSFSFRNLQRAGLGSRKLYSTSYCLHSKF